MLENSGLPRQEFTVNHAVAFTDPGYTGIGAIACNEVVEVENYREGLRAILSRFPSAVFAESFDDFYENPVWPDRAAIARWKDVRTRNDAGSRPCAFIICRRDVYPKALIEWRDDTAGDCDDLIYSLTNAYEFCDHCGGPTLHDGLHCDFCGMYVCCDSCWSGHWCIAECQHAVD